MCCLFVCFTRKKKKKLDQNKYLDNRKSQSEADKVSSAGIPHASSLAYALVPTLLPQQRTQRCCEAGTQRCVEAQFQSDLLHYELK